MQPHNPEKTVILLAEDDLIIRNLVSLMLARKGYGVLVGANGSEALTLLKKSQAPVNVLITNVMMPLMKAAIVRRDHPDVKIVIMSGQMDEAIRSGNSMDAFLQKPFVPATLLKAIEDLLDNPTEKQIEV